MTGGEEASRYEEWSQSGWRTHLGGPGSLDIGREVALLGDETIPALAAAAAARVPGRVAVSVDGAALTHAELDEQAARVAGWLAGRIDGPVRRAVGELKVELVRKSETVTLSRPQDGVTATLSRTARPEALVPLPRRETRECLAEDLRRLDADAIYFSALEGIDRVEYL